MSGSPKLTVGLTASYLSAANPRGVTRAARAVAERLVGRAGLRLLAIAEPEYDAGELVCPAHDLGAWLAANPLRSAEHVAPAVPPLRRAVGAGRRALAAVGLERPGRFAYRLARQAVRRAPPAPPAPAPEPAAPPEYVSLRDLDAVLSFECYDPIWRWPLESYGCSAVGVFHDAIPFRVNEGPDARPAEYLRTAGLMALRASVICCDSHSTRADFDAFFPGARARTRVVHLGHDTERFRGAAAPAPRAGKRIAMVGDIEARKNQANVLRACRHLAAARPGEQLTLTLIGRPMTPDPLAFLAEEAGRYVRVERAGYTADDALPALLAACDCFVYPSLWEGFGIPVLEAMSAGVPVVCSDLSSLPEVAGPHAFYCDPHDPRAVAAAVARALALPAAERAARTTAARDWAARFTWDATADRFHDVLTEVAGTARTAT